jgi:hypothetical protein
MKHRFGGKSAINMVGLLMAAGLLGCSNAPTASHDAGSDGSGGGGMTGSGGGATGGRNGGTGGAATGTGGATGGPGGGTGGTGTGGASAGIGGRNGGTGGAGAGAQGGSGGGAGARGSGGAGGSGGVATTACKRGVAANTAPGAAFFPAVSWWYDWSNAGSGANTGIAFVPMIWGGANLNSTIPATAKYLLGFNEPNFHAQSNLTAAQAAADWPSLQTKAAALGIPLVSPGMNFCGPAADCNGTDPYQYLTDFFTACTNCEVDYVAVHWYNCDLPSLKDYLEPGGSLAGFQQFGKPIWLTEFSCDTTASAADQEAYMRLAIPYLESNPNVFRYSWFSADAIPNAKLINSDGSPTALGQVYIGLAQSCQ